MTCLRDGIECEGYGTRLHWKATVDDSDRTSATSSFGNDTMRGRMRLNDGFVYASQFQRYRILPFSTKIYPLSHQPSRFTNSCLGRRSSVFNTYIPEDPIIAASTTKLERQYLRHFLTYIYFSNLMLMSLDMFAESLMQLITNQMVYEIRSYQCQQAMLVSEIPS